MSLPYNIAFEYKYIIKDSFDNIIFWEYGKNRIFIPLTSNPHYNKLELRDNWRVNPNITIDHLFETAAFKKAIFGSRVLTAYNGLPLQNKGKIFNSSTSTS